MPKDYFADAQRMENEYRALISRARFERAKRGDQPSEAECNLYYQASALCAELSRMGEKRENEHWAQEVILLQDKINAIRLAIDPNYKKETDANAKTVSTGSTKVSENVNYDTSIVTPQMIEKWYRTDRLNHTFDDVSGMKGVKDRLMECVEDTQCVDFLKYMGMKTVHSLFFVGPPGCGKTFIIEAFAKELVNQYGYQYMYLEGADIFSKFVGHAQKIIQGLFEVIKQNDKVIVFIDEIESICMSRSLPNLPEWASDITTSFLTGYNKLVGEKEKSIIFMGATNYPQKVDAAMLDRVEVVEIGMPDLEARTAAMTRAFLVKKEINGEKAEVPLVMLDYDFDYTEMGSATEGYNYRDMDRLTEALKKAIVQDCMKKYGNNQKECIRAIEDGTYRLTRKLFFYVLGSVTPSPKDEIIKQIEDWKKNSGIAGNGMNFSMSEVAGIDYDADVEDIVIEEEAAPVEVKEDSDDEESIEG